MGENEFLLFNRVNVCNVLNSGLPMGRTGGSIEGRVFVGRSYSVHVLSLSVKH